MGTIVVDIMPKADSSDAQGAAVADAVRRAGTDLFTEIRQGKRFVLTLEGDVTAAVLADARRVAESALSDRATEEVVSVREAGDSRRLDDDVTTDWDDLPEHWGGGEDLDPDMAQRQARLRPVHHDIDASMLGHVESGSYYGRADDVH